MKTPPSPLLVLTLAGCLVAPGWSFAASSTPSTSQNHTSSGNFQTSAGIKGSYEETFTAASGVVTDALVYTSSDGTETKSVTTTTTTNTDGTTTVVFSDLDFGATVAFTSTTTYAAAVDGSAVGTGTYIAVDGTTGTLGAIVSRTGQAGVTAIDFTSAAGALTHEVRLEAIGGPGTTLKVSDVDVLGTLTTTTLQRFDDMHHPQHGSPMGH